MRAVPGRWIAIGIVAVIGIVVAIAGYYLFSTAH
jgi:hypothetical protein